MPTSPLLASVLKDRSSIVELVLAAVVLGLGVNLLSSAIGFYFQESVWSLTLLGISLIVLSVAVIARRMFGARNIERAFQGFVCFRGKTAELVAVPRYVYVEQLITHLKALFAENEAPKKLWESDLVHKSIEFDSASGTAKKRTTAAGQLLVEATEYFVLETLSTHLTDYFNTSTTDKSKVRELGREDVPSLVFSNRFLDTFSRPMRDRAAFVDRTTSLGAWHDRTVSSYGPGGVRFARFDLVLPVGATVVRLAPNSVQIDAPKFTMDVAVEFNGFATVLPRGFEALYIGDISFADASFYQVGINVNIAFKRFALLSKSGWEYHAWLDSFLLKLDHQFTRKAFLEHIHWDAAVTVARLVQRVIAEHDKKASS